MTNPLQLDPNAVQWSVPRAERDGRPVVVLLHGYGSDEHDLFGLVQYLPQDAVYASVRAPLTPPWPMSGASWYPIEGLNARDGAAITAAAEAVVAWADAEGIAEFGLLGFSQGGAVATQTLRIASDRVRFVVNLAGYVAEGDLEQDAAMRDAQRPVFWGRGALDEVIPAARIEYTTQWLPSMCALTGGVYPNLGHAISGEELQDVVAFIARNLVPETPTE